MGPWSQVSNKVSLASASSWGRRIPLPIAPASQDPRNKGGTSPSPRGSPSTHRLGGDGKGAHEEPQQREQAGGGHRTTVRREREGWWPGLARVPSYRR